MENTPQQNTSPVTPSPKDSILTVPMAIIIAGLLIAGALYYSKRPTVLTAPAKESMTVRSADVNIIPVTEADHILGNPNAPIKIVEFADLECPACIYFHPIMKRVMAEYGKDGKVAWVYRHFPLDQIHPKARKEAEATECVAKLGGNDQFWKYVHRIFEISKGNNTLEESLLGKTAVEIGINKNAFDTCLASGIFKAKIQAHLEDGIKAGVKGTPYSIIITKDGTKIPIEAAYPYENMKIILDAVIKDLK
jgi:protein-disulfide isomerase